jgi:hypothetical protein
MAAFDQLEIVNPDGSLSFHDLDPAKGTTNIGSDPENDIVIAGPQVASFLAMIDHRDKPYQIMILDQDGQVTLDGQPLNPNQGYDLYGWSTVEINGHSLVLMETGQQGQLPDETRRVATAAALGLAVAGAATTVRPSAASLLLATRMPLPPADRIDEVLIAELLQRDATIECEQTASYPLNLINGGDIVATFEIAIEGLDPDWVIIEPSSINLNEGEHASVTIAITPPRVPASRAGAHHFAVVVTSPNHAGRTTRLGATINLNPFFDSAVSDLSPRQNYTGFRKNKRTALTRLTLANKGNAEAIFRVDGEDDQHGCAFEYQQPEQGAGRSARQTEIRLSPETATTLAIYVTPVKRRLVGLRKHSYSLTITSMPLSGQQTPRSVLGQLQAAPLIGPWILLVMLALLTLAIVLVFRPQIYNFGLPGSIDQLVTWGKETSILGGQPVTVGWQTSSFAQLKLMQEIKTSDGATTLQEVGSVNPPVGSQTLAPPQSVRYRLLAGNLLSSLLPFLGQQSEWVAVTVKPVPPNIEAFDTLPVSRTVIVLGESTNLVWRVLGAEKVTLMGSDGLMQSLTPTDTGSLNVAPLGSTKYTLGAVNYYGTAEPKQVAIVVVTPTPTPVPKPSILQFDVQPRVITEGQSINISWDVEGAATVKIVGIPGAEQYPPKGNLAQSPPYPFVEYSLIAKNGPPGAEVETSVGPFRVTVNKAPPPPVPPTIPLFEALPTEVVRGTTDAQNITLQWQISGPTTDVTLSGGADLNFKGLPAQGELTVAVDKTTIFILTAINGPTNAVSTQTVKVDEPVPAPILSSFSASPNSINQGESTSLSWTVVGVFSDITVESENNSSLLKKPGQPGVGALIVTPGESTTYRITVSYLDSAGKLQKIKGTTSATVIPAPQPSIEYFQARCSSGVDCGATELNNDQANKTVTYKLYTGYQANLFWRTQNAGTTVTLTLYDSNNSLIKTDTLTNLNGQESPPPPFFTTQRITNQGMYYILSANNGVNATSYKLVFQLETKPPQPPYSIDRSITGGQIGGPALSVLITWKYSAAEFNNIIGFRLKRTPLGSINVDKSTYCTLSSTNSQEYNCTYVDNLVAPNTCGIRYSVGARYLDVGGVEKETDYTDEVLIDSCPTN